MSRGLGRVERFILSWLASEKQHEADLWALSHAVAGNVDCPVCMAVYGPSVSDCSAATYSAVARAVTTLERKGYVQSEFKRPYVALRGGATRWKRVQLNVEAIPNWEWLQRFPCQNGYDEHGRQERIMNEPTWRQLVAKEPKLGDLLAECRAWRGDSLVFERFFWSDGGIADRLSQLLRGIDFESQLLACCNDAPLGLLWHAAPMPKEGIVSYFDAEGNYDAAAHRRAINADALHVAEDFEDLARDAARLGQPLMTDSGKVMTAGLLRAVSVLAYQLSQDDGFGDDDAALGHIEAALAKLQREIATCAALGQP